MAKDALQTVNNGLWIRSAENFISGVRGDGGVRPYTDCSSSCCSSYSSSASTADDSSCRQTSYTAAESFAPCLSTLALSATHQRKPSAFAGPDRTQRTDQRCRPPSLSTPTTCRVDDDIEIRAGAFRGATRRAVAVCNSHSRSRRFAARRRTTTTTLAHRDAAHADALAGRLAGWRIAAAAAVGGCNVPAVAVVDGKANRCY